MKKGVVEYDENGLPKCHICGKSFKRVATHVRQVHGMSAKEYKKEYGLDSLKGICSKESSKLSRQKVMDNYEKVVKENLTEGGKKTRFQKGDLGRTKDMMSEQTKIYLSNREITEAMRKSMSENGKKYGKKNLIKYNKNKNK